jgi:hypothetical protein
MNPESGDSGNNRCLFIHLQKQKFMKHEHGSGSASAVYGLGFIGAAIYYVSTAAGFWMGLLGLLKAIVWPAFLVYEALKVLGA